jgi:hypothetical protein
VRRWLDASVTIFGMRSAPLLLVACALPACTVLQSGPDPDEPTPWMWGIHGRTGVSSIHEDVPDPVDTPGTAADFSAFAARQFGPHFAAGLAVDVSLGFHGEGMYPAFALALAARSELPHLTLASWASWYVGNRLIDADPTGMTNGDLDLQGPGGALAALWRLEIRRARVLELGPWVQGLWLHSTGDDPTTDEDEDGAGVRMLAGGVMAQFVFGGAR